MFSKSVFDRLILQTNAFSLETRQGIITIRHAGSMSDILVHASLDSSQTHPVSPPALDLIIVCALGSVTLASFQ